MLYKVKLKRMSVLKTACFLGLYGVFLGIILDLIMLIFSVVLGSILSSVTGGVGGVSSILKTNFLNMLMIPLISGIVSFLLAFIIIPLMNLALKIIHGIDLEMEGEE